MFLIVMRELCSCSVWIRRFKSYLSPPPPPLCRFFLAIYTSIYLLLSPPTPSLSAAGSLPVSYITGPSAFLIQRLGYTSHYLITSSKSSVSAHILYVSDSKRIISGSCRGEHLYHSNMEGKGKVHLLSLCRVGTDRDTLFISACLLANPRFHWWNLPRVC